MSTTPEITGRARGGGNGRPAAGTMHGKPVGSWESPSKDIGVAAKLSNSGLILLRLAPRCRDRRRRRALSRRPAPGDRRRVSPVGRPYELLFYQLASPRSVL